MGIATIRIPPDRKTIRTQRANAPDAMQLLLPDAHHAIAAHRTRKTKT